MSPTVCLLVLVALAVAGALVYALSANAKAAELGRMLFACALLAGLFRLAQAMRLP